jgi:hypothetical protein
MPSDDSLCESLEKQKTPMRPKPITGALSVQEELPWEARRFGLTWLVTQSGHGGNALLPAQCADGLYKTKCHQQGRDCRSHSALVLRDGESTFLFKLSHHFD